MSLEALCLIGFNIILFVIVLAQYQLYRQLRDGRDVQNTHWDGHDFKDQHHPINGVAGDWSSPTSLYWSVGSKLFKD